MNDLLLRLLDHMRWADQLAADSLVPADTTDPQAIRLFAHIASVEHLWYSRILGRAPEYAVWPKLSVAHARTLAAQQADLFESLLRDAGADELARIVAYRNSAGRDFSNSVEDIVTHVFLHGEHHRGQIARLVRGAGREPAYTDYIQFARRDQ